MDYVVYGTGYGATLMLLGYAVRTWGPGWRFREGEEGAYDRREYATARASWTRFTAGLGAVIATGGAALVLATFLLMLLDPGNSIGNIVALVVTGLMLIGVAVWSWLYVEKFGSWGVLSLPNALSSYQPLRYDSGAPRADRPEEAREPAEDDDELVGDEVYDVARGSADHDEYEDEYEVDEFAARSSKYELHHPSGDDDEDERDHEPAFVEDDRFEGQYAKYEAHAFSDEAPLEPEDGDTGVEEIEEYVETLTPEEVSADIADLDDDEHERVADTSLTGTRTGEDDAGVDDPFEILPEAHDATDLLPPAGDDDDGSTGGREAALRRLRERQARQRGERQSDDA